MITLKQRIREKLEGGDWWDKGKLSNEIAYEAGAYGDTVARVLRKMTEDNEIIHEEYPDKRGSRYRLKNIYDTAKELNPKPNLF